MRNTKKRLLQAASAAVVVAVVVSGAGAVFAAVKDDPRRVVVDDPKKQQILDKLLGLTDPVEPRAGAKSEPYKLPVPSVAEADEPWPLGIFADGEAPFPAEVFVGTSNWVGTLGPQYVVVYAGSEGEAPADGAARVLYYAITDGTLVSAKTLTVPPGEGALTISTATATDVVLTSANGTPHTFSILTGDFI